MYRYTKKLLLILSILAMPSMNIASQAMGQEEYESKTGLTRNMSVVEEDQKEDSTVAQQSAPSQTLGLEDSQDSWASYLLSCVQNAPQNVYKIMNHTVNNPYQVLGIAALVTYQLTVTAVVASQWTEYDCLCRHRNGTKFHYQVKERTH